jgi:hypothetical protein
MALVVPPEIQSFLTQLGIGVLSSAIYGKIQNYLSSTSDPSLADLKSILASTIQVENADIKAEKIVEFLANNGDIKIRGTNVYSSDSITMTSSENSHFQIGNGSSLKTDGSAISFKGGGRMVGQGGAKVILKNGKTTFSS